MSLLTKRVVHRTRIHVPLRVGAAMLVLALGGCTEYASIRSGPSGGIVTINGRPVGKTPLEYGVPRGSLDEPHKVTIELAGYEPALTTLRTRLAKGRVTGAVFTLGVLAMFRSMYYIEPVFAQLRPIESPVASDDRALGEALRNLRELHRSGKISDEELRRRQDELLMR
jgi:PEGA domain